MGVADRRLGVVDRTHLLTQTTGGPTERSGSQIDIIITFIAESNLDSIIITILPWRRLSHH